jgi:hypothetical protein
MTVTNTSPFNLSYAVAGEPIVTRSGDSATFIAYVPEATFDNQRVLFLVNGQIRSCNVNGLFNANVENASDLFMLTKTSEVNGFSYPVALTEAPAYFSMCYVSDIASSEMFLELTWTNDDFDYECLTRGIVHSSAENAIAHTKALILACGGSFD